MFCCCFFLAAHAQGRLLAAFLYFDAPPFQKKHAPKHPGLQSPVHVAVLLSFHLTVLLSNSMYNFHRDF